MSKTKSGTPTYILYVYNVFTIHNNNNTEHKIG